MKKNYLTNAPLDEAVATYLQFLSDAGASLGAERVQVSESFSRITSEATYAKISSPHYLSAAMDGVALDAAATFGASETTPVTVMRDAFVPVDTGDPLPDGTDAVVMIEDVLETENGAIRLLSPAAPWQHVRQIGEDVSSGDMLLPSYTRITPYAAGAMLAGGVTEVPVLKKPLVGVVPTGDEIVPPTDCPKPGEIMEFNSVIFSGMLESWGASAKTYPIVPDDPAQIAAAVARAAEECDLVLVLAGTSAGRDDTTAQVIASLGEIRFHGVAIRPGKPVVLGRIGAKAVLGVPGYPVSGILVLERILRPVLLMLTHQKPPVPDTAEATLSRRVVSPLKYREFVRAALVPGESGDFTAVPLSKGAGVVTSFVKADCLIDIPQNSEGYEAGTRLPVQLLKPRETLQNRISIVGSHDPLLDEAADLLRRRDRNLSVSSAHVGSMGGISAIARHEADMGGVHLLDGKTGKYNDAYIARYFPSGGVALVECVTRVQGLMVGKGNPKRILGIADLAQGGISFVNRQKGSGTRVLLDYLLKEAKIPPETVRGYPREELTHTAVAAQIAAGTADAGLGILAAARLYGLDFLPLWDEQYELLMPLAALEKPEVQAFLDVLQSSAFACRLDRLGGYKLHSPGSVRRRF